MKNKPNKQVYKTDDGYFIKDQFTGYKFYPLNLLDEISKRIDTLLNTEEFATMLSKKEPLVFTNKEPLLNIALSMVYPFLHDNHRAFNREDIKVSNSNGKIINLGYPRILYVSINDPSGDIINIDPEGFFRYVYDGVNASLALSNFMGKIREANGDESFNIICPRLAGDITDNIVNAVFSVNEDKECLSNTFRQTFQAKYNNFSWRKRDNSEAFNCSFKIEFINFRNFNKNFSESKVCRLFSINDDQKYLLMGCTIKIYLEDTIYIGHIEDQESKPE